MAEGDVEILVRGQSGCSDLLGFYIPDTVAEALRESKWDIREMVETLAGIARDESSAPRDRMAAMKMMDEKARQALVLSGAIRKITAESVKESDEGKQKVTAESLRLIEAGAARTLSTLDLLAAGADRLEIIDVEPEEVAQDDARAGSHVQTSDRSGLPTPDAGAGRGLDPGGLGDGRGGGGECRSERTGDGVATHGQERANTSGVRPATEYDNPDTVRGAENARSRGTSEQRDGGDPSGCPGAEGEPDSGECGPALPVDAEAGRPTSPTRRVTPYTPGEARRRAVRDASRVPPSTDDEFPDLGTGRPPDGSGGNDG